MREVLNAVGDARTSAMELRRHPDCACLVSELGGVVTDCEKWWSFLSSLVADGADHEDVYIAAFWHVDEWLKWWESRKKIAKSFIQHLSPPVKKRPTPAQDEAATPHSG